MGKILKFSVEQLLTSKTEDFIFSSVLIGFIQPFIARRGNCYLF
jgi:hypothetical protein